MSTPPSLSVVVPVFNEQDNVAPLIGEIVAALRGKIPFEIVYVDDCSRDGTLDTLKRLKATTPELRVIRHLSQSGQSTAVRTGVKAATGAWIATLDGDGQNNPVHIMELTDKLLAAGPRTGIAVGQRLKRGDSSVKKYASRFANGLRSRVLGDKTRDTACGLKVVRTDVFRRLPFFEGSHRFLPALVLIEGYEVVHSDVVDRPRHAGKSHYGIFDRGLHGALDLFGVWWLRRRRKVVPAIEEIADD